MKQLGNLSKILAGVLVLGVLSAWSATAAPGKAIVRAVRGQAQYAQDSSEMKPLTVGKVLREGALIVTGTNSEVDLFLGLNGPVVRVTSSTELRLDALAFDRTGVETVIQTNLDLRSGRIQGHVKKLAAASRYEVRTPNGVAGIRGTDYDISADDRINVPEGSVSYVWRNPATNQTGTYQINAGQAFNPLTQSVGPIPPAILAQLQDIFQQLRILVTPPTPEPAVIVEPPVDIDDVNNQAISPYNGTPSSGTGSSGSDNGNDG